MPIDPTQQIPPAEGGRRTAWLCGGYEPGDDGVGDYVRCVSAALAGGADHTTVVALADRAIRNAAQTRTVLRLPAGAAGRDTVAAARKFLDERNAEVLAWNFVPQMFARRGIIPAAVAQEYAALRRDRRLVLFLHELWCGTGRPDTWRNRITGALQRPGILRWLDLHRPDYVLTSNEAYAAVLKHQGIDAAVVPLCSNIPRRGGVDRRRWPAALAADAISGESRAEHILAGVFGAVHPVWHPGPALAQLADYAGTIGKKVAVVWFGRSSADAEKCWARVSAGRSANIRFLRLGPLAEAAASEMLESCDLGLPTIQFNLLGKSGTAAAFVEHGVPLLVVSDAWSPRFPGFAGPTPGPAVARWSESTEIDWAGLLAARPTPGSRMQQCLQGWQRILRSAPALRADSSGLKPVTATAHFLPSR